MKKILLICVGLILFSLHNQAQTVTDFDGNVYNTIPIGNLVWMKENLKVTHYRNGEPIPSITDQTAWAGLFTGARCYYNNDSIAYDAVYGSLYNWYAVNNVNNLCPEGWHVPSDSEWATTETFLGGSIVAGGKMKEPGTSHWKSPNTGATNESEFTGIPGGMRGLDNTFSTMSENGLWWASTTSGSSMAWSRYLWYLFAGVDRNPAPKTLGLSVRCVKDTGVGLGEIKYDKNIKLYPNPATEKIFIDCSDNQNVNLEISNLSGVILIQKALAGNTNEIDINSLTDGIYMIKLTGDSWKVNQKLVKE